MAHEFVVHWRVSFDSVSQIWNTESCSFSPSQGVGESILGPEERSAPFHSNQILFEYKTKARSDSWGQSKF